MKMEDMVIVSVDDHITEPGNVFDNHLTGEAFETAPKLRTTPDGSNYWEYQGRKIPSIGLNAVVGRPPEEYGMEPTSLGQLRDGCYDVHERIKDMNVNGIAASMNFASFTGLDGGIFFSATDKSLAVQHMRAYNDWHIDEWCGAYPGRFIPCCFLPLWDMDASVAEVKRLASKGCHSISVNDNPGARGLPSIHTDYWEGGFRSRHDDLSSHWFWPPASTCVDGYADRGVDYHNAHVDCHRCCRLAESGGIASLPINADCAVRRRHRLDSLFHGAR